MSGFVRALSDGMRRSTGVPEAPAASGGEASAGPILVTGADHAVGAALAVELAGRGLVVHCAYSQPQFVAGPVPGMEWHLVPSNADPGYLPALRRIVDRHDVSILIPTLDEELAAMSALRRWPDPGVLVVVSGAGSVALADDKLMVSWQLAAHGVRAPRCGSPSDFASTEEALDALGGAVVVRGRRPATKSGGSRVLLRPEDLDWGRLDDDFVVQEFVPGREYLCVLYRPDGSAGRASVVYQAVRPGRHGDGIVRLAPGDAEDVHRTAWSAIRALGVVGPAEVVVRTTTEGAVVVLSVHPRFSRHCSELLDELVAVAPTVPPEHGSRVVEQRAVPEESSLSLS
ncbi:MAG TPA: hypothetical protein VFL69_09050 [Marmoricola sp.]|nr:hypothetical protein [Marmoricola sp.]